MLQQSEEESGDGVERGGAGMNCLALHPVQTSSIIATGNWEGHVMVWDLRMMIKPLSAQVKQHDSGIVEGWCGINNG